MLSFCAGIFITALTTSTKFIEVCIFIFSITSFILSTELASVPSSSSALPSTTSTLRPPNYRVTIGSGDANAIYSLNNPLNSCLIQS